MRSRISTLLVGLALTSTALLLAVPAWAQTGMGSPKVSPTTNSPKPAPGPAPHTRKLQRRHTSPVNGGDQADDKSTASTSANTDPRPAVAPLYNPGIEEKKQGIDAYNRQQYDQAIERLNVAAGIRKADAEVFYYLGDAYEEKDNYLKAIEAYEHAIGISGDGSAENFFRLGYSYEMLSANSPAEIVKNNTSALQAYRRADQKKPNNAETLTRLGDVSSKLGQWKPAIAYYQQAFDLGADIKDPDVFLNWGLAFVNSSLDYESALPRFKRAIELNVDNLAEAYYQLGMACRMTNRPQEAFEAFRKQLEMKNDDFNAGVAYAKLADIYSERSDWQAAAEAARNGVRINSKDDHLWYNLGTLESNVGRLDASAEAYAQAVALAPANSDYQLSLAKGYFRLKRYNDAIDVLNKTIETNPAKADAFYFRGASYRFLNQYDPAIQSLNRAIEIGLAKRLEGYARYYLVVSYRGLGNTSAARQQCDALRSMGPDAPPESVGTCAN